mgnify:FL=1
MKKVKLGELVSIQTGKLDANAAVVGGKYPFFTTAKEILWINDYVYDDEVVLVAGNGDLNVKYYKGKFNAYQRTYILSNNSNVRMKYLYYFLDKYIEVLRHQSIGGVIKYIKLNNLSNAQVPMMSIPEQEKIIQNLEKIDYLISKKSQQYTELSNLVKSRFNEMFGDDSNFDIDRLNNSIKEMFIGPFGSSLKNEYFVQKEKSYCMVYEQKHAIKKTMNLETRYVDEKKYKELKRFSIYGGDIIVSCRGTIGEIFQVPNDAPLGIMHPSIMKIRLDNSKYIPVFFTFMLSEYMKVQKNNSQGSGVKMAITASELGKIEFPLPPLSLQNEFADFVAQVDKSQFACQKAIKLWRNSLKSSII